MNLPDNIAITKNIADDLKDFFSSHRYSKVAVIVDENTKRHCYPRIKNKLPKHIIIELRSGEEKKNLDSCQLVWNQLTSNAFDRKSLVINLGGGVIGDMGGFCAATYKRGIDFINIPTTLLAQVDASIGGKLGIDFHNFKNHIGVFKDPLKIFIDVSFFETLDPAELRSGFAEIIKHCLIRDENMFEKIASIPFIQLDFFELTKHSVDLKHNVVIKDPTEKGLRKILNFGHTIGHAIESHFLNIPGKKMLHGEAIAVGMICETFLSNRKLGITSSELEKISSYILTIYPLQKIDELEVESIFKLTRQDKKNEGDKINCSLLNKIGECAYNINIDEDDIKASFDYFNTLV